MTPEQALKELATAAKVDQFELSSHCIRESMPLRQIRRDHIRSAMRSATTAVQQEEGQWRFEGGRTKEGESLVVVAKFRHRCLIITVF